MPSPSQAAFGMLDLIGGQLDKHKDRLGPFYRPLYLLSGAAAFIVCFALLIGLPVVLLEDFAYVAFVQIVLVAVYFMLLLTIQQNVFDRFVYATVLFTVACAAPVLIGGQAYLGLLTGTFEGGFFPQQAPLPKVELFLYGTLRGMGNVAWALPLLFYVFTFYPRLAERSGGLGRAWRRSLLTGAVLHAVASGLLLWHDAVVQRATASTDGAEEWLAATIATAQRGYLAFTALYVLAGFAVLLVIWRWRLANDRALHVAVVGGLAVAQLAFALAGYNVRQLNQSYPAARTTADSVRAFRDSQTGGVVFTDSYFDVLSGEKLGSRWQPYSSCDDPESGRFTFHIAPASDFGPGGRFQASNAAKLRDAPRDERARTLFCQPPGNP